MDLLRRALDEGLYLTGVEASDFASISQQAVAFSSAAGLLPPEDVEDISNRFVERENVAPTSIGQSVAIPHIYDDRFTRQTIIFVRLERPLNVAAPDGTPTRFFWFLCGPTTAAREHLDVLAEIARITSDDEFRYEFGQATSKKQLLAAFDRVIERTKTPSKKPPSPVQPSTGYSFIPCTGMLADLRRRIPYYVSDYTDGLNSKSLSSILFLFFACLAPAITFGAIYATETHNSIGIVELIVATIFCGVVYALISGQPLVILGGTGPLLIFTIVLFQVCEEQNIPFLESRAWVGIWTALIVVLLAVFNTSSLISLFTRFTDEIFAALISLIFIFKAVEHLLEGARKGMGSFELGNEGNEHLAVALLAILLAIGTFYIATALSRLRHSRFLSPTMREFLADFGPSIAVLVMAVVAVKFFDGVPFEKLEVSDQFQPSQVDESGQPRPWLLNLFGDQVPTWVIFGSIVPAFLLSMLVYADQNITARLVNSPDHHLKKGEAYHWDLGVVGVLLGICSIFGLPWLVAATVRSLNHVRSLAKLENEVTPSGETRERVIHVQETRVTGVVIHLLIGLPLFFVGVFNLVPTAVLYGLFLFMGVVSLAGNQFFERLTLWVTDRSLYPSTHYSRKVPKMPLHLFTLIQLVCLGVLWGIKESRFDLFFPLFIIMLVPIRIWVGRFFKPDHLAALDAEEEPGEEDRHWSS